MPPVPRTEEVQVTYRLLTQGEVEEQILRLSDELEAETDRYARLADKAATAEADYKLQAARLMVGFVASPSKMTALEKQARVDAQCDGSYRVWKINEAQRQASKEALLSLRTRLDSLRTLSANIRNQT
jgi:hypothetical protein